jgi:NAD dependent epimerase/dehydratase family enzyme
LRLGCPTSTNTQTADRDGQAWRVIQWDAPMLGPWVSELGGADVVINLAVRSVNCRYTPENRQAILESRVQSVAIVGKAIVACATARALVAGEHSDRLRAQIRRT